MKRRYDSGYPETWRCGREVDIRASSEGGTIIKYVLRRLKSLKGVEKVEFLPLEGSLPFSEDTKNGLETTAKDMMQTRTERPKTERREKLQRKRKSNC